MCQPGQTPLPCPAGYYQTGGSADCTICPAGSYCADPTLAPVAVPAGGYYATAGSTYYMNVPPGYNYIDSSTAPTSCGTGGGVYWSSTTYTCTICPAGSFCPNVQTADAVFQCPAGFYSPLAGASTCLPCPAGFSCAVNAIAPTPCSTTSGSFSFSYGMAGSCTLCPAGYGCSSTSAVPVLCAAGQTSSAGQGACLTCPPGKECLTLTGGSASMTTCSSADGSASYFTGAGPPVCILVPPGYKFVSTTSAPSPCPPGTYSLFGAISCTTCPANSFCPVTDASPVPCPPGYSSAAGATACQSAYVAGSCAVGTFAWPNASPCIPCPEGFECLQVQAPPRKCVIGWKSAKGDGTCVRCTAGSMCPSEYKTNYEALCSTMAGTYSLDESVGCYPYPANTGAVALSTTVTPTFFCTAPGISPAANLPFLPCATSPNVPAYCNWSIGEVAQIGNGVCAQCPANSECPTPTLPAQACRDDANAYFTSRVGEGQCFPAMSYAVGGIYPDPVPTSLAGTTGYDLPINPGFIGYRGMPKALKNALDCPPGYQCPWPDHQNWQ